MLCYCNNRRSVSRRMWTLLWCLIIFRSFIRWIRSTFASSPATPSTLGCRTNFYSRLVLLFRGAWCEIYNLIYQKLGSLLMQRVAAVETLKWDILENFCYYHFIIIQNFPRALLMFLKYYLLSDNFAPKYNPNWIYISENDETFAILCSLCELPCINFYEGCCALFLLAVLGDQNLCDDCTHSVLGRAQPRLSRGTLESQSP